MIGNLIFALAFIALSSVALTEVQAAVPPVCQPQPDPITRSKSLGEESASFFISVDPSGDTIYWISPSGNRMTRMPEKGKETKPISSSDTAPLQGTYDPVVTPDGRFLTIPGMSFFKLYDLKMKPAAAITQAIVRQDSRLGGVYQSVGILSKSSNRTRYRIITDVDGGSFKDFDATDDGEIKPTTLLARKLCPGLREKSLIQTPMLSKDGRYLAAYDYQAKSTKIYRVADDGSCKMTVDLGIQTGKVDFDFSSDRIAFHVSSFGRDSEHYYSGISSDMTRDVFVAKLSKDASGEVTGIQEWARLTSAAWRGSGTYYPRFTRDGEIAALRVEKGQFELAMLSQKDVRFMPYLFARRGAANSSCPDCAVKADLNAAAVLSLGSLWADTCAASRFGKRDAVEGIDAMLLTMKLPTKNCRALVHSAWSKSRDRISTNLKKHVHINPQAVDSVTEADIAAACP